MNDQAAVPADNPRKGKRYSPQTEFKKGIVPKNKLPIGSTTIRTGKGGTRRRWIKTAEPNKWILYAVYLWVSTGRSIPPGHVIHHVDHNALNDSLDNLAAVTRAEHARIHKDQLAAAKPKVTHVKEKVCPDCGLTHKGRGRYIAKCPKCTRLSNNNNNRAYKERKRRGI